MSYDAFNAETRHHMEAGKARLSLLLRAPTHFVEDLFAQ